MYSPMKFILRLRPDIHKELSQLENRLVKRGEVTDKQIQAFSTFFHETIHWWQHVGSTSGLILSLSHPAQAHINHGHLLEFLKTIGPVKSILKYNTQRARPDNQNSHEFKSVNNILNNFYDIEYCRGILWDPQTIREIYKSPYFLFIGHCYEITWASTIWLLSATFSGTQNVFPDPRKWESKFAELTSRKVEGFFESSRIGIPPLGLFQIYEGQARFSQIQYLYYGSGETLTWDDFRKMGMLDGVYIVGFELFLKISGSLWPEKISDPLVALFLLVCDLSINPSDGFPFEVYHFESFITTNDPGRRFIYFSTAIRENHSDLKSYIKEFSIDEYQVSSKILCDSIACETPLSIAAKIVEWAESTPSIQEVVRELEPFKFRDENLPVRLFFSKFIEFQKSKLEHPHYFCWPGAWSAGTRTSTEKLELFLKHQAPFVDKADGIIYPVDFPGKVESVVLETFNKFYAWNVSYDLCRQWITKEGPFDYDYFWLTTKYPFEDMEKWVKHVFENSYNVPIDSFSIL